MGRGQISIHRCKICSFEGMSLQHSLMQSMVKNSIFLETLVLTDVTLVYSKYSNVIATQPHAICS